MIWSALSSGEIRRLRKGWYGSIDLPADIVAAVKVGGRLGCVSAARQMGLWTPQGDALHVSVPANTSRLRTPTDYRTRLSAALGQADHPLDQVVVHWANHTAGGSRSRVGISDCLTEVFFCLPLESAFVIAESALNKGWIDPWEWQELLLRLPHRARSLARKANSSSDSGGESLMKLILFDLGVQFRQQVIVGENGPADFLVGDCLILEVDSRAFHSDPYRDRKKDAASGLRGYRSLRFMYSQVLYERAEVASVILAAVSRGDHLA
jgi:very-short-patch-repair endonuclease